MTHRYALPVGIYLDGAMVSARPIELPNRGYFPGAACCIHADLAILQSGSPPGRPLFPKRLRLSLQRVFYHLDLNQVGFTGDVVGRARNDREDVAGLGLQNFHGGLGA